MREERRRRDRKGKDRRWRGTEKERGGEREKRRVGNTHISSTHPERPDNEDDKIKGFYVYYGLKNDI